MWQGTLLIKLKLYHLIKPYQMDLVLGRTILALFRKIHHFLELLSVPAGNAQLEKKKKKHLTDIYFILVTEIKEANLFSCPCSQSFLTLL